MPRSSSHASNDPIVPPSCARIALMRCQKASSSRVASAPAIRSEWPFRYLVAECMTMSAPRSSGRVSTGVAAVESTASFAPAAFAIARRGRDVRHRPHRVGRRFDPDEPRLARAARAAARAAGSPMSMSSTSSPHCVAKPASQLRSDQYMTFGASTWSPGASARNTAVAAAMPGGKQRRLRAVLQRRKQRLGLVERGVVGAGIGALRAVLVVGVAQVGRGGVDRRGDRARRSRPPIPSPARPGFPASVSSVPWLSSWQA